jgi:hypothetical protein
MNADGQKSVPGADFFTRAWSDFATQMVRAGTAFTPGATPPQMSQEMRNAMFKAWGDYCDQYMRSPEFMDMMKQSLGTAVEARKQLNEFLGRVQSEFQQPSRQDVDQIMAHLHHLERRIVDRIDAVAADLEDIKQKITQLERNRANGARGGQGGKKKSKKDEAE